MIASIRSTASRRALAACALALLVAGGSARAGPVPPKPDRYVTDQAGVLPLAERDALEARLAAFDRETSNQVLVCIAPHVPEGTTPEELGADAIRAWGVGQAGRDNGIVFFVFTEDRKTRIATGYGLEGAVPDAVAKRILAETVRPHLARGDFASGIRAGVDALLAATRGEVFASRSASVAGDPAEPHVQWLVVVGLVVAIAIGRWRRFPVGVQVLIGVTGLLVNVACYFAPFFPGWFFLPFYFFGILGYGVVRYTSDRSWWSGHGTWSSSTGSSSDGGGWRSSSSSSSGSSRSSGSSSSSGFSGGGGDSGGGGASDRF